MFFMTVDDPIYQSKGGQDGGGEFTIREPWEMPLRETRIPPTYRWSRRTRVLLGIAWILVYGTAAISTLIDSI